MEWGSKRHWTDLDRSPEKMEGFRLKITGTLARIGEDITEILDKLGMGLIETLDKLGMQSIERMEGFRLKIR